MQQQKPFWITARQLTKLANIDRKELEKIRKNNDNKGFFKLSDGGGYLYNAHMVPELLKKEHAA